MKYYRLIAPQWLLDKHPDLKRVIEGMFTDADIQDFNQAGYNVYYLPNHPKEYDLSGPVRGDQVDTFNYVFVDYDTKSATYESKEAFTAEVLNLRIPPTRVIDSGGGIHVYYQVSDLDAKSYQRLTRRLVRLLNTDEAVGQIFQLMRMPGTMNTKLEGSPRPCEVLFEDLSVIYTCEQLDKLLPTILPADETYCQQHYDRTYNKDAVNLSVKDELPPKFGKLLRENHEVKDIWSGNSTDRSKDDYRLGHIMFAADFTREEATSVLINTAKALKRAPIHRINYAENIINKIWTYEEKPELIQLSSSVEDILKRSGNTLKGTPFRCHKRIDNTEHGFRLGQVIGLVAGSGVGKTSFALNMFLWSLEQNPDYHSFFVALEQPANEIADRIKTMTNGNPALYKKIHILSNYNEDDSFRHLSLSEIRVYIERWQKDTGQKVGMVCVDHIGALKKKGTNNENQDLITVCHDMKAFAIATNTLLLMQSQTSREKAGIGDIELDKGAAYGTSTFEWYCDYLITMHQPLKRCHAEPSCPTVTAFKYCKIRHKKANKDIIKEDVCYYLKFDPETELLKDMTQDDITSFEYFLSRATNKRKVDKKTELIAYTSVPYLNEAANETDSKRH